MQYVEEKKTVVVPKNVGPDGFVLALKNIIKIPRVQRVEILANGTVEYTYFKREGAPGASLSIDFETLAPSAVVRNTQMRELELVEQDTAPVVVCRMFRAVRVEGLVPISFVTGADSAFWKWHDKAGMSGLDDAPDSAYGLPLLQDRYIPDDVLVLCAGYDRNSALVDTVMSFKTVMLV